MVPSEPKKPLVAWTNLLTHGGRAPRSGGIGPKNLGDNSQHVADAQLLVAGPHGDQDPSGRRGRGRRDRQSRFSMKVPAGTWTV